MKKQLNGLIICSVIEIIIGILGIISYLILSFAGEIQPFSLWLLTFILCISLVYRGIKMIKVYRKMQS